MLMICAQTYDRLTRFEFNVYFSHIELDNDLYYHQYLTKTEENVKMPDEQLENVGYPINKKIILLCLGSFLILFMFVAISGS